ncbi:MAG: DUF4476 domain-containing protein [Myxococcota bacterium]|nr:DUF4476 domain-containing protein [Myxococcota bacterium]
MLALLPLFFPSAAQAADIHVSVDRTGVFVLVDGQRTEWDGPTATFTASGLPEGSHLVQVSKYSGKILVEQRVAVLADDEVRMGLNKGELREFSRSKLAPVQDVVVVETTEQVQVQADSVSVEMSAGAGGASVDMRDGAGGVSIEINVDERRAPPPPPPGNSLVVTLSGMPSAGFEATVDGRRVRVDEQDRFVASGLSAGSHQFDLLSSGERVMGQSVRVSEGVNHCTLYARFSGWALECQQSQVQSTVVVVQDPGPPPPPPGPVVATPREVDAILRAVEDASFSSDQLDVLRSAAAHHHFTCAQAARLVEPLSFSSDQVEALRILQPVIVDPKNAVELELLFTFSSDKEEVRRMFR